MRRYLIVGHTGTGKSSFINVVFGKEVARPAPFEACTKEVQHYTYTTPYGPVDLIDTPGLGETTPGQGEDTAALNQAYLDLVSKDIAQQPINVMFYVSRMDYSRFYPAEKRALQLITEHLGAQCWQGSWLALTHAAFVREEHFEETAKKRIEQISIFLQDLTSVHRAEQRFKHFAKILLIDNINETWNTYALPTTVLHGFAWKYLSPRAIELIWQGGK